VHTNGLEASLTQALFDFGRLKSENARLKDGFKLRSKQDFERENALLKNRNAAVEKALAVTEGNLFVYKDDLAEKIVYFYFA